MSPFPPLSRAAGHARIQTGEGYPHEAVPGKYCCVWATPKQVQKAGSGGGAVECVTPGRAGGLVDRVDRVDWLTGAEV